MAVETELWKRERERERVRRSSFSTAMRRDQRRYIHTHTREHTYTCPSRRRSYKLELQIVHTERIFYSPFFFFHVNSLQFYHVSQ